MKFAFLRKNRIIAIFISVLFLSGCSSMMEDVQRLGDELDDGKTETETVTENDNSDGTGDSETKRDSASEPKTDIETAYDTDTVTDTGDTDADTDSDTDTDTDADTDTDTDADTDTDTDADTDTDTDADTDTDTDADTDTDTDADTDTDTDADTDADAGVDGGIVECAAGRQRSCAEGGYSGTCGTGFQYCRDDGTWSDCSVLPSTDDKDRCDEGNDDNCNGFPNEECPCLTDQEKMCSEDGEKGACGLGKKICTDGIWGECSVKKATKDNCDGAGSDDNCDGKIECLCSAGKPYPCEKTHGTCATGVRVCNSDGQGWGPCSIKAAEYDTCAPGNDDNCNGIPNETENGICTPCTPSTKQDCQGTDVGQCNPGESTCTDNYVWGPCEGAVLEGIRNCSSSLDNDCDGHPDNTIDEICECDPEKPTPCGTNDGLCEKGIIYCELSPDGSSSRKGECTDVRPTTEVCNGKFEDEDCDGDCDEGCHRPIYLVFHPILMANLYTQSLSWLVPGDGWEVQNGGKPVFYVSATQGIDEGGLKALYMCKPYPNTGNTGWWATEDPNCSSSAPHIVNETLGYVAPKLGNACSNATVYHIYHDVWNLHYLAGSKDNLASGWRWLGVEYYVWTD